MTDHNLKLFCLVSGEPTSNAFPVKVSPDDTVGDLKELIKAKKAPRFDDVAAAELALWHISIPIQDEDEDLAILLDNLSEKKKLHPTDDLSDIFEDKPPKKTIHILVQRPLPGLISERDFVRFVPGALTGQQQRACSSSISHRSTSVTPSVRLWTDFKDNVRSMALDLTSQYPHPHFKDDREYGPELSLQELFANDIGSVKLLPPFSKTTRIMGLPRGIPDLVCIKKGGNFDDPESVLFPLEIRRPIDLRSENLVRDYELQKQEAAGPVQRSLRQTFGYMRLNGYRYGVLSTYEQTWFLMRAEENSAVLWVSPTVAFDSPEPTLLQCYLWFIRKAHNDEEWAMDPPNEQELETIFEDENPPDHRQEQKDRQYEPKTSSGTTSLLSRLRMKTRSSSRAATRVVLPAFDNMELISHDERAQTYRASWMGQDVVVKKCDLWNERPIVQELKHEAKIYSVLQTLQGRYIPTLRIAAVADSMEMVLVTDFAGRDISRVRLDDADQEKIRAALSAIHDLGVVHGDLRPQNILVQRDGSTSCFYFVDFGLSRITTDKSELFEETTALNSMLRNLAATWP